MREVEQLARAHGAGEAWDALSAAGRKEWAEIIRAEAGKEPERQPKPKPNLAAQSKAVDRFMAQFWAPVLKEQRKKR